MKPTLLLIRHGATDFNSESKTERLRGWLDVPLNKKGQEEADEAGEKLAHAGVAISRIVASDLNRTQETALRVAKHVGDPAVTLTKGLRPWNLGEMSGQPLKKILPEMQYFLEHEQEAPPQGESFVTFQSRALSTIIPLSEEAKAHPERGAVVIVTHSRDARLLRGWYLAGCRSDGTIDMQPLLDKEESAMTGHIMVLQWNGRKWELSDESALQPEDDDKDKKSKKETAMRDPFEVLGEQVVGDMAGEQVGDMSWGSAFQGLANTAGTAIDQSEKKKASDKSKAEMESALQKSLVADSSWASAEVVLELAAGDPVAASSAKVLRDSARKDADKAASGLDSDASNKRCQAALSNLKDAAAAATKSPKDTAKVAKMRAWQKISDSCSGGSSSDDDHKKSKGDAAEAGGDGGSFLTKYHGPLPMWGWGLVAIGGLGIVTLLIRAVMKKKH